jgi:hypothetical protein
VQPDPNAEVDPEQPVENQPSLVIPAQPPQSGFGGAPSAVSGGS